MSDILNRDDLEAELARAVGGKFAKQRRELIALLGVPPSMANVPMNFWDNGGKELRGVIAPIMEKVYLQQAMTVVDVATIGFDWALVNTAAIEWVDTYTFELVKGITNTSVRGAERKIRQVIQQFYDEGLTMPETISRMRTQLSGIYGPIRAEMIAITEVTRAGAEGERATALLIDQESGVKMIPIWQTANDELVCPICGPKHGKEITGGEFPPAHPRCRCWVSYELPKPEKV